MSRKPLNSSSYSTAGDAFAATKKDLSDSPLVVVSSEEILLTAFRYYKEDLKLPIDTIDLLMPSRHSLWGEKRQELLNLV